MGNNNKIVGNGNIIMGNYNKGTGNNNTFLGNNNKAHGNNNILRGNNNRVKGNNNILEGMKNKATGKKNKIISTRKKNGQSSFIGCRSFISDICDMRTNQFQSILGTAMTTFNPIFETDPMKKKSKMKKRRNRKRKKNKFRIPIYKGYEKKAPKSTKEDMLCCVCKERPKCVLLQDCNHVCLCVTCSRKILKKSKKCPICRNVETTGGIKIFIQSITSTGI